VKVVSRWLRQPWVLLGDGAFAGVRLAWTWVQQEVILISRLRLEKPAAVELPKSNQASG
jgi:hypothetical protein